MLQQRWTLGILAILISSIAISQSWAFSSHVQTKGFWDDTSNMVSSAANSIKDTAESAYDSAVNGIKDTATNIANSALDIKNDVVNSIYNKTSELSCNLQAIDPEWLMGLNLTTFLRDMEKAVNEKKTQDWVDSVNKMFNIPRVVDEIKTSQITKVTCVACKSLLLLAKSLIAIGQTDDEIAKTATTICTLLGSYFEAKDPSVCKGLMKGIGLDAIYSIRMSGMRPAQICQQFFGDDCLCGYDSKHDWSLGTPQLTDKQTNTVKKPPPDNPQIKFKVLQLTDIHYDRYYQPGSESDCDYPACCRVSVGYPAKSPSTAAGNWGDYRKCDSPKWLIENAFEHIANTHPDLSYILWTGDMPPHDIWNQSRESNLQDFIDTTNLISQYFPKTPVLPVVGNHESFPIDSFVPPSLKPGRDMTFLYDELANEWKRWLPNEAIETVRKGGYYSVIIKPGFRVISVNGNYCGRNNFLLLINSFDPYNQLAWLAAELEMAESRGEKVHILNHVPPGGPDCLKTWSQNYYEIINRFSDIIMGQFYGHTHFDEFEVFYDTKDFKRPTGVAYIAPSITPWKDCDPAYRIYYIDGSDRSETTGAIIDFEVWKMDLDKANAEGGSPHWYKYYNARNEYNMDSLLPQEWDNLIKRMAQNKTLFDQYLKNYYRNTPTYPKCNDNSCRRRKLCDTMSGRSHDRKNLCRDLILS